MQRVSFRVSRLEGATDAEQPGANVVIGQPSCEGALDVGEVDGRPHPRHVPPSPTASWTVRGRIQRQVDLARVQQRHPLPLGVAPGGQWRYRRSEEGATRQARTEATTAMIHCAVINPCSALSPICECSLLDRSLLDRSLCWTLGHAAAKEERGSP
eukprot:CAMPEP_0172540234 /NCGR_PEP_ID=MMETSP1067-20121228/11304_1 /TAXON_ID=265564 ORGANISM="Thalassiosira punctigera, Strain Tpunct2005C2" /NCGR_SAMPLE_ID=MMETSP1067 /ASSEMBLY_ACC=CAM_ASM_000444 /LENGTH=155 /DNA_ID=CAMNT_0013326069 /DNA_START=162 /DNA_END=625 /DNA_ORIENTATION=+